jgi:hypothetical protein
VLTDGEQFDFFCYEGSSKPPKISRGVLKQDGHVKESLTMASPTLADPAEFILGLRPICETLFWIVLKAFITGIDQYLQRSSRVAKETKKPLKSTTEWLNAFRFAQEALKLGVRADSQAKRGLFTTANATAEKAASELEKRCAIRLL